MLTTQPGTTACRYLESTALPPVADTVVEFLADLGGPTWLHIKGRRNDRCRVVTTLLHGNEPSGAMALHRWLREGLQPAVDLHCFIASVEAALTEPLFTHRMLPGHPDLNRCFKAPFAGREGAIAQECLAHIEKLRPEAVVDIHNTSGDGPAFGVSTCDRSEHNALTACFTHRIVITDLQMGALFEATRSDLPMVTVEVGGNQEAAAHQIAYDGLCHYAGTDDVFAADLSDGVFEVLEHPLRLELAAGASLCYADKPQPGFDVTVTNDIERHNFGTVLPDTVLGWLGVAGLSALTVRDSRGNDRLHANFRQHRSGRETLLLPRRPLKLFMATPDPTIAASDCLFYLVPVTE